MIINYECDWQSGIFRRIANDDLINSNEKWSILCVGDISPSGRFEKLILEGNTIEIFGELLKEIKSSDLALFNLETTLTLNGIPSKKLPMLKTNPDCISKIAEAGFNIACLSNNHIMDFGEIALKETISNLNKNNIQFVGAGFSIKEACKPLILNINKTKIAIVNFSEAEYAKATESSAGACDCEIYDYINDILQLKKQVDIVIVIFHGGKEFVQYPLPHIYEIFNKIADLSVPLVIGHHPHVPQGLQIRNNSFLFYSLGNFIFDFFSHKKYKNTEIGYAVKAYFVKEKLVEIKLIPYFINPKKGIICLNKDEKVKFLNYIKNLSENLNDDRIILAQENFLACQALKNNTIPIFAAQLLNASSKNPFVLFKNLVVLIGWLILKRKQRISDRFAAINIMTNKTHKNIIIKALDKDKLKVNNKNFDEEMKKILNLNN